MTTFATVLPATRGIIMVWAFILCADVIYAAVNAIFLQIKAWQTALRVFMFLPTYAVLQILAKCAYIIERSERAEGIFEQVLNCDIRIIYIALTIIAALAIFFNVRLSIWQKTHISPSSVKDGIDKLPTGLCFADADGVVLLKNTAIDEISRTVINEPVLDAKTFWWKLKNGDVKGGTKLINGGETPIIRLNDARVELFERKCIITKLGGVYQISAVDISEVYAAGEKLEHEIESLKIFNTRLLKYNDIAYDLAKTEEALAAKEAIHDKLGRTLITTRRYIEKNAECDDELLSLWKENVALLRMEGNIDEAGDSMREIYTAAALARVHIKIVGRIPREERGVMRIMTYAARECLNNAMRHAGATAVRIDIRDDTDEYTFMFTNNGTAPEGEIVEGGGITGLRQCAGKMGAQIEIRVEPNFALILRVPKMDRVIYDKCFDS